MRLVYISIVLPLLLSGNSLLELVDLSQNNEVAKSAILNEKSIENVLESTKSAYLPSLSVGSAYQNISNERRVSLDPKDLLSSYANISYSIYDGGKKSSLLQQLKKELQASKFSRKNINNTLALNTVSVYFNLKSISSDILAKTQEIEQLKADVKRLEKFKYAGAASQDEVEKIKSDLAFAQTQKSELLLSKTNLIFNLRELTGIDKIKVEEAFVKEPDKFSQKMTDIILAQKNKTEALKFKAEIEKSSLRPQVSLDNTYTYYDTKFKTDLSTSKDSYKQNKLILSVKWKIFDFGSSNQKYEASKLSYESAKSDLAYEKRKADLRYSYSIEALDLAKNRINSAKLRVKSADLTFIAIAKKFKAGLVDNIAYLDALSDKYNAKAYLQRVKNDYEIKKAEFYYYAGYSVKEMIQ
ncbi:TolC family protein [Sulfurospirillum arcachonense]|uniref:TolC family protein n=1 Tax=Sulfurospirillum arcachonense TaxID=57666 RepID=UPI000468B61C|nr:TolC family protein [Sulfurospirillum arcachonense]